MGLSFSYLRSTFAHWLWPKGFIAATPQYYKFRSWTVDNNGGNNYYMTLDDSNKIILSNTSINTDASSWSIQARFIPTRLCNSYVLFNKARPYLAIRYGE